MAHTIKKGRTYLDALNKIRKDKGKSILKGKPLKKKGPVTLNKLAKKADKSAKRKKR